MMGFCLFLDHATPKSSPSARHSRGISPSAPVGRWTISYGVPSNIQFISQPLANQANREMAIPPEELALATRVCDFMRMKLLELHGSKIEEDLT